MYQILQYESPKGTIMMLMPTESTLGTAFDAACAFKSQIENIMKAHAEKEKSSEEEKEGEE